MGKLIDLHVHTTASDGDYSPEEIVKKAKEAGLSAIAISDHDSVGSIEKAIHAGNKIGVEVVPAVELTTYWSKKDNKEFHILGYYFDYKNEELLSVLEKCQRSREDRAKKIVEKLNELGFVITYEEVDELAKGSIGMPHVADVAIKKIENKKKFIDIFGKIPDVKEFIHEFMIIGKPAYTKKYAIEPFDAIDLIHKMGGGVAVLAHPCWDVPFGDESIIKQFADWGIDGIEAIQGRETKEESEKYIKYFSEMARKYNLIITGGSDFHSDKDGKPGGDRGLGLLKWNMKIPYEILKNLQNKKIIK
ncbi:MAG: PHP domain-containing protein [Parcubacteria group bacterium Athens0714_16]|nr:MAG: PHP domain-containing protein [Parcubacteria group bacterium Athens0714_16]